MAYTEVDLSKVDLHRMKLLRTVQGIGTRLLKMIYVQCALDGAVFAYLLPKILDDACNKLLSNL